MCNCNDKKELPKWEQVNDDSDYENTQRLRVYGGWLLLTTTHFKQGYSAYNDIYREAQYSIAQSFITDPNHEWLL